MVLDPRLAEPDSPIYQTPDKVIENRGNIQRRERDVYLPPEQIQRSRAEEYRRQLGNLAKENSEEFRRIRNENLKAELKGILGEAVTSAALDAAFMGMGGGARRRGRFGKADVENGGAGFLETEPTWEIERSECEVCLIRRESELEALMRYRRETEGDRDLTGILIPRKEKITCWRLNNPKCRPPIEPDPEPLPEIPEAPHIPPVTPHNPGKCDLSLGLKIRSRSTDERSTPTPDGEVVEEFTDTEWSEGVIPGILKLVSKEVQQNVTEWARLPNTPHFSLHNRRFINNRVLYTFEKVDVFDNPVFFEGQPIRYLIQHGINITEEKYSYNYTGHLGFPTDPITDIRLTDYIEISCIKAKETKDVEQPTLKNRMKCNCSKLEKDLKEIKKVLGISKFPINSPRRLIQPRSKGNVKLKDFPSLFENLTRQIDRAVGFLPMTIEIKDSNLVQAGNQPIVVQVESIADGLREILQILCNDEATGDATQNIALRTLYEAGITHKMMAEVKYELDEIQEFLGYEIKEKNMDVPFAYNPLAKGLTQADKGTEEDIANVLPQILEQSKVKIRVGENVDKKTLYSMIQEIHTQATVAAAGVSERVGSRSALDNLMDGAQVAMDIAQLLQQRQILKILGGLSKTEFENLMNELELRYTKDKSPVPEDIGEPYQQDNQPKIKLVQLDPSRLTPPGVD